MLSKEQKYRRYPCHHYEMAQWSITGKCNYRCRHCFMYAPDAVMGEPTYEQCRKIMDELEECGIDKVSLTGGEPLVRRDFWKLVDELRDRGIGITAVYTNGKLLDDAFFRELDARKMHPAFQTSFDGVGWHDWLRGIPGAETAALDAFRRCREHGCITSG